MRSHKMTCYLIGAGFMGLTHVECYNSDKNVEILGIIDVDEAKGKELAVKAKCRYFSTLDEAFAYSKVDFVDVCLPSSMHAVAALQAMDNGADVIVEKPFSITVEDADAMIDRADKLNRRLFVAHVCRFMPQYTLAKKLVGEGRIGKEISIMCSRKSPAPLWGYKNWFQNKELSGGTLLDLSIHDIDIANWFLGESLEYSATISSKKSFPGASHVISQIGYKNGEQAMIIGSHLMPQSYELTVDFTIVGTKGSIEYTSFDTDGTLTLYSEDTKESFSLKEVDAIAFANPYQAELKHFVDCLMSGSDFAFSAEEARQAVISVHNLHKSAHFFEI